MTRAVNRILALFTFSVLMLCWPLAAHAATWTVTSTADDGSSGTLRQVIANANAGDTINFDPTVFATPQTITLTQGVIGIVQNNLIINGPAVGVVIDGSNASSILTVSGLQESLSNLTFRRGNANDNNGGTNSGGGVTIRGTAQFTGCTFSKNFSYNQGGGVFCDFSSNVTFINCTFNNNSGGAAGGGIDLQASAVGFLENCTFYQNSAFQGGGVYIGFKANLGAANCTFDNNFAGGAQNSQGGAIMNFAGVLNLVNSILAFDADGEIGFQSVSTTTPVTVPIDQITTSDLYTPGGTPVFPALNFDPQYLALGNNGGLVQTIPLAPGSPCYGAGTPNGSAPTLVPTTDARGITRPNPPSLGAFDLPVAAVPTPEISPEGGASSGPQVVTITDSLSGATIYYTTDGTPPSISSPVYNGSFPTVSSGTETIQAIATASSYNQSQTASATFTVTPVAPSYPAGLNLISSPEDYPTTPLDTLFGYTGVTLAVWDPTFSQYDIMPNGAAGSIRLGIGYWVRNPNPVTFTSVGTPAPTNEPFTVFLERGWNQIGDPFLISVPLTSLTFGPTNLTFAQASSGTNPLVGPTIFGYDPAANNSAAGYVLATELDPMKGYWIFAFSNTTMQVSTQ